MLILVLVSMVAVSMVSDVSMVSMLLIKAPSIKAAIIETNPTDIQMSIACKFICVDPFEVFRINFRLIWQ